MREITKTVSVLRLSVFLLWGKVLAHLPIVCPLSVFLSILYTGQHLNKSRIVLLLPHPLRFIYEFSGYVVRSQFQECCARHGVCQFFLQERFIVSEFSAQANRNLLLEFIL